MARTTQTQPTPTAVAAGPQRPTRPAGPGQPAIEVTGLRVTYRGSATPAVDGVSFRVAAGEIFGFLGPNGAGKSTTQRVLTRQIRTFTGTVRVLGRDIRGWNDSFFEHIGVGFELPASYPRLTVAENLTAFAGLYDRPTEDPTRLLGRVGLLDAAGRPAGSLSKGMQMRLNLARAMLPRPEILFLDEPTSGLDPVHADDVRAIVREAAGEGRTVFLTTHDMATAGALCDRVAFMVGGRLAAIDTPRALKLQHGQANVRVEYRQHGQLRRAEFALPTLAGDRGFRELLAAEAIETIHSEEASLGDVFADVTGSRL
ncbi:MAG TPA: ABC transporter ATP-binding protein [Streptosporangiaceae bacterium]|nr:ABC transporter ATP-binding protein [Streptosporangiaceae bacterium]